MPTATGQTTPPKEHQRRRRSRRPSSAADAVARTARPARSGTKDSDLVEEGGSSAARAAIRARAAAAAARSRVTQATAPPPAAARHRPVAQSLGQRRPQRIQRRRLLAPGADPDRDRRSRGDLDRRGRDHASGASAAAPDAHGLAEGELADVDRAEVDDRGRLRAWTAALAVALLGLGAFAASAAQAVPASFWGVVPQATPTPNSSSGCKRGGVDSIRIPIDWGAVQPTQGGADRLVGDRPVVGRRRVGGPRSAALPQRRAELGGPVGRVPGHRTRQARLTCRSRPAPQRSGWSNFVTPGGRPLRAERQLLGREPDGSRSGRSAPGRSGTSRTSSTSSPGPTRPNTASWSSSPTRRSKASIRAPS